MHVSPDPIDMEAALLDDDPDGVDDPGEVAEEGQDEADPELDLRARSENQDTRSRRTLRACMPEWLCWYELHAP